MAHGWIHTVFKADTQKWVNHAEGIGPIHGGFTDKEDAVERGRVLAVERETQHVVHNMDGTIKRRRSYEAAA